MKARPATPIPLQTAPTVKTGLASLIALGAAQAAHAQIVMSPTMPNEGIRPPSTTGFVDWDVDNDGTADFRFNNSSYAKFAELNGGRIMGLATDLIGPFQKLSFGQTIGASVPGFGFGVNAISQDVTAYGTKVIEGARDGGWFVSINTTGDALIGSGVTGYLGFRFTTNGGVDTHYGWANVTFDGLGGGGYGYIFNEAYYNSTPGASITAGAVPEPAAAATGLGLLALGAAGLRRQRWLQRNKG